MGERKKAVKHLVASHKHGLAAISRKKLCLLWGEEYGEKYPAFSSNIYQKKWRRKAIGKMGKKWKKDGEKNLEKKLRKKYGKKSRKKITKKVPAKLQKKIKKWNV